jgi:hypothetical protein
MADDELAGRTIVRSNADFTTPIRGCYANHTALAGVLSEALANSSADLFNHDGRIMLLAKSALYPVNAEILHTLIQANLVIKGLRIVGSAEAPIHEKEYRPVAASDIVVRTMLTAPVEKGGLAGRLPVAALEEVAPQETAA